MPSLAARLKTKSLVAVFAHPDDEISVAGFLAEAAQRNGVMVRIITATKGESGHPRPPICRPEDLGKIREAETLKDGFALGVQEQEVWTFPDGRLSEVPPEELAARIGVRLRKWKPDLVVTFDPGSGFTLHPDHLAIGRATVLALREIAVQNQETPPRLLYPLAPRKALARFGGEIGRTVAASQPAPQFAVLVPARIKVQSWQIQQSLANFVRDSWGFPLWLMYRLMDKEFYTLAPLN